MAIQAVEQHFGNVNVLPDLSRGRQIRMQLAEARDGFAVHDRARRPAGMKVLRCLGVERQRGVRERGEQIFDVALHVEEAVRLRGGVDALRKRISRRSETEVAALVVTIAALLEDLTRLEQSHVGVAAVQVVADHVEQAGEHRRAHVPRLFAERIGDGQRLGGCPTQASFAWVGVSEHLRFLLRDERDRYGLVVAERQHGLAHLGVLQLVSQRHYRANERGQRVGKFVVAMDARQLFQQINFALHVKTPGRNLYREIAAGCACDTETEATENVLDLYFVKIDTENTIHLRAMQRDGCTLNLAGDSVDLFTL